MPKIILFFLLLISQIRSQSFAGKVVLITGGSSGIGYTTALEFARNGANVVFCGRDSHPSWYNGTVAEIQINSDPLVQSSKGSAKFIKADIRNIKEIRNFINTAHSLYNKIDIAINNAGILGYTMKIEELEDKYFFDDHDAIYNNLYGTLYTMREEIRQWLANGDPNNTYCIINLSSIAAQSANPTAAMYAASKGGIDGLTKSIALEQINTKPKIRVNSISPGYIETSMTRNYAKIVYGQQSWEGDFIKEDDPLWIDFKKDVESHLPGRKIGKSNDIAKMILEISHTNASYVTGTVITVDDAIEA